jgi:hypothetical protein
VTFDPNEASVHEKRGRVVADRECLDDAIALRRQADAPHQDSIAPFSTRSGRFGRKEAYGMTPTGTYLWLQREPVHTPATDSVARCLCRYSTYSMDDTLVQASVTPKGL